jgi:hypothetical protein
MNMGKAGSLLCDYSTDEISHPESRLTGYQGSKAYGILIAGSEYLDFCDIEISRVDSYAGSAFGICVETDTTDVDLHDIFVEDVKGGCNEDLDTYSCYYSKNPNEYPFAAGINVAPTTSDIDMSDVCVSDVYALAENFIPVNAPHARHPYYGDWGHP